MGDSSIEQQRRARVHTQQRTMSPLKGLTCENCVRVYARARASMFSPLLLQQWHGKTGHIQTCWYIFVLLFYSPYTDVMHFNKILRLGQDEMANVSLANTLCFLNYAIHFIYFTVRVRVSYFYQMANTQIEATNYSYRISHIIANCCIQLFSF